MFKRDISRLKDSLKGIILVRLAVLHLLELPHKIDGFKLQNLGFDGVTSNCMDSVSDRDFALELLLIYLYHLLTLQDYAKSLFYGVLKILCL